MYKDILKEQLFNKFEDNSNIAIFGACSAGKNILNDIKKYKKNSKVVCFIDNFTKGTYANLPIFSLKEFIEKYNDCKTVIMSTKVDISNIVHILRIYNHNVLEQTKFLYNYYRLYHNNYEDILNIFETQEDKNLYKLLLDIRLGLKEKSEIVDYYNNKFPQSPNFSIVSKHYLEKINLKAIKTIFDLGFHNGLNAVAYNKTLPNLETIYAFDAIYEKCADKLIESFIKNEKLEIVNKCVGDKVGEVTFLFPTQSSKDASFSKDISTKIRNIDGWSEQTVEMIDLDSFIDNKNTKVDYIKLDIEGAELSALTGAIKTIKKDRPQLAISIYHSNEDFIKLPLWCKENLENYTFRLEHYGKNICDTVLYAIPNELK